MSALWQWAQVLFAFHHFVNLFIQPVRHRNGYKSIQICKNVIRSLAFIFKPCVFLWFLIFYPTFSWWWSDWWLAVLVIVTDSSESEDQTRQWVAKKLMCFHTSPRPISNQTFLKSGRFFRFLQESNLYNYVGSSVNHLFIETVINGQINGNTESFFWYQKNIWEYSSLRFADWLNWFGKGMSKPRMLYSVSKSVSALSDRRLW